MVAALGHLEGTSRWNSDLQEYLFRKVQKEGFYGARQLKEPGPLAVTRDMVVGFDAAEYHQTMLDTFPLITALITAIVARPGRGKTYLDLLQVSVVVAVGFCSSTRRRFM